jgi:hypothetical protein
MENWLGSGFTEKILREFPTKAGRIITIPNPVDLSINYLNEQLEKNVYSDNDQNKPLGLFWVV